MREDRELGIYIHIPFCARKCAYCDFLSAPASEEVREKYVQTLIREIGEKPRGKSGKAVTSIFFGGGTPSLLSAGQTERILSAVRREFRVAGDAEITTEANPGTLKEGKPAAYRQMGFNRLSIGLQSSFDEELRLLGRVHTWEQFLTGYEEARTAGFKNINIDLMAGLPGQTARRFRETLRRTAALLPEHVSVYSLIVEEGTPFWTAYGEDALRREGGEKPRFLPEEEEERRMYRDTLCILREAGYERYEISNYARPGYVCRHNDNCWRRREYLGFGIGAASLYEEERFSCHRSLARYLDGDFSEENRERLSEKAQMEEMMFLGLRRTAGVDKAEFQEKFGVSLAEAYGAGIRKYQEEGLLWEDQKSIGLTGRGLDVSSYVMAGFLRD